MNIFRVVNDLKTKKVEKGTISYDNPRENIDPRIITRNILTRQNIYLSGQLFLPIGSAADPAIAFGNDNNNGLYLISADTIGVSIGGAELFRFSSAGMAAGTTTGRALVSDATSSSTVPAYSFVGDTNCGIGRQAADNISLICGGGEIARINSLGIAIQTGDLDLNTIGGKIKIAEGGSASMGQATMIGGTIQVNITIITANSRIFLSAANVSGTAGFLSYAINPAVSFTITSSSAIDTRTINYLIIEPS